MPNYNYTLNSLAEQVQRLFEVSRPTAENKLEKREIIKAVRIVASELTRKRWYEMKQTEQTKHLGQLFVGEFTGVIVRLDDKTSDNYIYLPAQEEDLPSGDGIQSIVPEHINKSKNTQIIPIPPNAEVVLGTLPASSLEQRWGFMPKRDRVTFTKLNGRTLLQEGIKTVKVVQIVALADSVDDVNAPVAIPADMVPEVIRQTLAMFGVEKQMQEDVISDNQNV